ncbi:MAG: hypothetical protein U0800_03875 [Isosphaeraceae bacterium]
MALSVPFGCSPPPSAPPFSPHQRISGATPVPGEVVLRLDQGPTENPSPVILAQGLDRALLDQLAGDPDACRQMLVVQVAGVPHDTPPMLGRYELDRDSAALRFLPRFPLDPSARYRATWKPAGAASITAEFVTAPRPTGRATRVVRVDPSADLLPENLLRFYVHFSAPMSRGESYRHIRLVEQGSGKPVDLPFLEIAEELWADRQTRLTLLCDPARVKRGLASREEAGPILEEGKSYALEIGREWPDANGRPLKEAFRKTFRVGPPDANPIDPEAWIIRAPRAGGREPLVVTFPKPLDRAILAHAITVQDPSGSIVPGLATVEDGETRWRFRPERDWTGGEHALRIDSRLEDLSGNAIGRPFEVDLFERVDSIKTPDFVIRTFRVGSVSDEGH